MTTPPIERRMRFEYQGLNHVDEFIMVIDALGRVWNPLKHPRDQHGRFIRTFSFVSFKIPGSAPGAPNTISGRVSGVDRDGNLLVKVQKVDPSVHDVVNINGNDYIRVKADQVEVQTIKAKIRSGNASPEAQEKTGFMGGDSDSARLNDQQAGQLTNGVKALNRLGLTEQARKLDEARQIAVEDYDASTPELRAKAAERKQRAIDLLREVGEALGDERGKGFNEGDDYNTIRDTLTGPERGRLDALDKVIASTFTTRQAIGDKTIDAENSEGKVGAHSTQVRNSAVQNELRKDQAEGAKVFDFTSGTPVETTLEGVQKAEIRDTARDDGVLENSLPALKRSAFQKLRSGLDRLAGTGQSKQVAVGSRWHVDAEGNEVSVGSIVHVAANTRGRREYVGMVTRIYTDDKGNKSVYVRDFVRDDQDEVKSDPRYKNGYKDFPVTSQTINVADENEQENLFRQLALEGVGADALVKSFTKDFVAQARRVAGPGAKRISPTAGKFFDSVPIQHRQKVDLNGQLVSIGDTVQLHNGEQGVVNYMEPNSNTIKVELPDGQSYPRVSSKTVTRLHGPTSDVFTQDQGGTTNHMAPTRDEAAQIAEDMGATQVAEAIRSGGDHNAIKDAMIADPAFQARLAEAPELYDRRDAALSSGKEPSNEDYDKLVELDAMYAASAGQFREPDQAPPVIPRPPEPTGEDAPQDPANPDQKVKEDGTVEGEDTPDGTPTEDTTPDDTTPDETPDDTPDARPADDTSEPLADGEIADDDPVWQTLGGRIYRDLEEAVGALKRDRNKPLDGTQKARLDKHLGVLHDAIYNRDVDGYIKGLRDMHKMFGESLNKNMLHSPLHRLLRGDATGGKPMADHLQSRADAGIDLFGPNKPATPVERPADTTDESPENVDPGVDSGDADLAESLLNDDGSTVILRGDGEQVTDGFYSLDPATLQHFDAAPSAEEIRDFVNEFVHNDTDGVSIWVDDDGRFHMGVAQLHDDEDEMRKLAEANGSNQYVNIADGTVHNIVQRADTSDDVPESIEDPRSEERGTRKSGSGKATTRTTAKQKSVLDTVASLPDAPTDVIEKVKNGEEIDGADASRLADFINGADAGSFDKPADKGLAQQLADKLAQATGEVGARPYPSQSTALSRSSAVSIGLNAQSQDEEIRRLTDEAITDVKNNDMVSAADKFREAADRFEGLNIPNQAAAERARTHADRLSAAMETTEGDAPAPEARVDGGTGTPDPTAPVDESTAPADESPAPADGPDPGPADGGTEDDSATSEPGPGFFASFEDYMAMAGDSEALGNLRELVNQFDAAETDAAGRLFDMVGDDPVLLADARRAIADSAQATDEAHSIIDSLSNPDYDEEMHRLLYHWNKTTSGAQILAGEKPNFLNFTSLDDFREAQEDRAAAYVAEESARSVDKSAPFDLQLASALMFTQTKAADARRAEGGISSVDEYADAVISTSAILNAINSTKDPDVRLRMQKDQINQIKKLAGDELTQNLVQIDFFLRKYDSLGHDSSKLREMLRTELDKHDAAFFLDTDVYASENPMSGSALAWRTAANGKDEKAFQDATVEMFDAWKEQLSSRSPRQGALLETWMFMAMALTKKRNNGRIPEWFSDAVRAPEFQEAGVFVDVLSEVDAYDLARSGISNEELRAKTGNRLSVVDWDSAASSIDEALVQDDRDEEDKDQSADRRWRDQLATMTPNFAKVLNATFNGVGGLGIRRVYANVAQIKGAHGDKWRTEGWGSKSGADERGPEDTGGVFDPKVNVAVIADKSMRGTTSVVHHELAHALDWNLGVATGQGLWFTMSDQGYQDFMTQLQDAARFGQSPEDSIMHWYFRNENEGAKDHNGISGTMEIFAESYAAYVWYLNNRDRENMTDDDLKQIVGNAITSSAYEKIGGAPGMIRGTELTERQIEMGNLIVDYFDDLENRRLPEIMSGGPAVARTSNGGLPGVSAPPAEDAPVDTEGAPAEGVPAEGVPAEGDPQAAPAEGGPAAAPAV